MDKPLYPNTQADKIVYLQNYVNMVMIHMLINKTNMKTKVVKLEIGKLLAIIIAIVAIAALATFLLQSSYFKGDIIITKPFDPIVRGDFVRETDSDKNVPLSTEIDPGLFYQTGTVQPETPNVK